MYSLRLAVISATNCRARSEESSGMPISVGSPALWIGFTVFVLCMLALDLGIFHRRAHDIHYREALIWVLVWISLAATFAVWIYLNHGRQRGLEFLTGYVIEYAL